MSEYARLYEAGCKKLSQAEITEAELDARLLLEYVCGSDHNTLLAHGSMEVDDEKKSLYMSLIDKRADRIPLAYIIGSQDFMGLDFNVSEKVLIPNQDTETLVEEALTELCDGMHFMDLCTGSGCIALSLLHYSNDTSCRATDISGEALDIASGNALRLGLQERIIFEKADLFPEKNEKFDIIVSNPPYIKTDVIESLAPEVRNHEPRIALDGRTDGLYFIRRILEKAGEYLYESGWLFMEIGFDQGAEVSSMMSESGFRDVSIVKDLGGMDRVVRGWYCGESDKQ